MSLPDVTITAVKGIPTAPIDLTRVRRSPKLKALEADIGALLDKYAKDFPKVTTFTIDEVFGGWTAAQKEHFDDGAIYDQVLAAGKKQ